MSQDIRRDRELDRNPYVGTDVERWKNIAYNENERAGQIQQQLNAANAKLAEANDALDQARRDAAGDPRVQSVLDWLDRKEATVAEQIAEATAPQEKDFRDLGALESRAAKLRHAQYDSKLLGELRNRLKPSAWHDCAAERPTTRYWLRGEPHGGWSAYRNGPDGAAAQYHTSDPERGWRKLTAPIETFVNFDRPEIWREITAAELPEGVTP